MMQFLFELGSVLSRLINVCLGGDADTTTSARVHIEGHRALERIIDGAAFVLTLGRERHHCRNAWLDDVARARAQIARHDANT